MTLYQITADLFRQLEESDNVGQFDLASLAKYYWTFESFMGLEYILLKGLDDNSAKLINELFRPEKSLGVKDFKTLDPLDQFDVYESGNYLPYLEPPMITKISSFIDNIPHNDFHSKYNSTEFNDNNIYPYNWHNDNSEDYVFNLRHLIDDFQELKKIFGQAVTYRDYILVLE